MYNKVPNIQMGVRRTFSCSRAYDRAGYGYLVDENVENIR